MQYNIKRLQQLKEGKVSALMADYSREYVNLIVATFNSDYHETLNHFIRWKWTGECWYVIVADPSYYDGWSVKSNCANSVKNLKNLYDYSAPIMPISWFYGTDQISCFKECLRLNALKLIDNQLVLTYEQDLHEM
jgi:hypothetical protein